MTADGDFLSGAFALISALLAGLGLYSVLAFFAQTHTREIGLRMALGSRRAEIVAWMSRQTAAILALGLTFGLIAALGLSRLLENSLFCCLCILFLCMDSIDRQHCRQNDQPHRHF